MKTSNAPRRGTVVAVASAVLLAAGAQAAPQKPAPVPAPQEAPAPKKSVFGKLKSSLGFTKKVEPPAAPAKPVEKAAKPKAAAPVVKKTAPPVPAPVAEAPRKSFLRNLLTRSEKPVPAPAPVAAKVVKNAKATPEKSPAAKPAAVAAAVPEKKSFLKNLFSRKPKAEAEAEPKLASVKTAKPVPVKGAKPEAAAELAAAGEKPAKRSFFSFLRGGNSSAWEDETGSSEIADSDKIERPEDWAEHRVTQEDDIALYEFGPSQSQGPDARLSRGTLLKVKKVERGWALVEAGSQSGYIDASVLRNAEKGDFKDPPPPVVPFMAAVNPEAWAPLAPPPDLPEQPGPMDSDSSLLLLPPLELEPKP